MLGRLWLTVLIDAFSRAVLGLHLAYEAPGIESIQGALYHAIWPKTDLGQFGIDLPWECYGIPQRLSLDNAWAHQSYSLEELARALGGGGRYTAMELLFRPPYQARYGGLVERLFGNLSGQLRERLPGAVLKADQRHWHNASQGACLLYRDLRRLVHQLVVDYLHTPHRELGGQTPHERWLTGLALMAPVPPPLTPHLERCFWRLHPDPRQATAAGLSLFGLHYWATDLAGLRFRIGRVGGGSSTCATTRAIFAAWPSSRRASGSAMPTRASSIYRTASTSRPASGSSSSPRTWPGSAVVIASRTPTPGCCT